MKYSHCELVSDHFSQRSKCYDTAGTWVKDKDVLQHIGNFLPTNFVEVAVLDLGSGTGAVSNYLIEQCGVHHVIAVDNCVEMLSRNKSHKATCVISNVEKLPFLDESFDCVVSRQCLHYVEEVDKALKEVYRVLKPGGVFVLAQIVPFDNDTKAYWQQITEVHQPLRRWYKSASDWDDVVTGVGLTRKDSAICSHRSSLKKWLRKYEISNEAVVEKMRSLLLSADSAYQKIYDINSSDDDISYLAFWHIAKYTK